MNWKTLTHHARTFYSAVFIEKAIPSPIRKKLLLLSGLFAIFFALAIMLEISIPLSTVARGFFLSFSFFSLLLMFDLLVTSFLIDTTTFSFKEFGKQKSVPVTFDVAHILHDTHPSDLTKGFLFSRVGREVTERLGLSLRDIHTFLKERKQHVAGELLQYKEKVGLSSYASLIFEADTELAEFLFSKNIQRNEWEGSCRFVEMLHARKRYASMWWSKENLSRIKSIGVEWSYGRTYLLDQYVQPIEPVLSSRFSEEVAALETILSRSREANAVLISEVPSYAFDVLSFLAGKIREGSIFSPIEHTRLLRLNIEQLIAAYGSKESFERAFLTLLNQSKDAGNIILVIPEFGAGIKNVATIGSDLPALLTPFLESPLVHVVALSDPEGFHRVVEQDDRLTRLFEKLWIRDHGEMSAMRLVEEKLYAYEAKDRLFFTYQAAQAIAEAAMRYMTDGVVSEKALDLLVEISASAKKNKKFTITEQDILKLVESKTGIPTGAINEEEKRMLNNLEKILHERIVGQEPAVEAVATTMKRARSGIVNPNRPLGSFLFLGPTGVGKTETAKALAHVFFGDEQKMMRLDMSEYNSPDALDKIIGSFTTGTAGVLTSLIREHPYSVLLLDEFEKAHTEVHDLFLQILDEGVFSDMFGKKVNARNLIIIATSNAGSDIIWEMGRKGLDMAKEKETLVDTLIEKRIFKPELLNRFDGLIVFHPLDSSHLKKIATLMLTKLKKRLYEKGFDLEITPTLVDFLVREGSDPQFGARPLNRAIQARIEKVIAEKIISGVLRPGSKVSLAEADLV